MFFFQASITFLYLLVSLFGTADSHGYISSPRARNYVAYEDGVWWGGATDEYAKDSCPHCLNRGGTAAQCGTTGGRNYDYPLSYTGDLMPADPQAQYDQGQVINVDILLTAHHKGHFVFKACPIQHGEVPTADCFDDHPLEFVSDPLYGAPKDVNYPNRAYIAPAGVASQKTVGLSGKVHSFNLKLPNNLSGDLVLLQWHYYTANSCTFPGYDVYPFPVSWGNMGNPLSLCGPLPLDGNGVPEQFWNCAEISISGGPVVPSTPAPIPMTPPTPANPPPPSPAPVDSSTPAPVVATTPAPVNGNTPDWTQWTLSTALRCGSGEADARSNCRPTCTSIHDCSAGQWCWSVHANYCDSKPQPTECNTGVFDQQLRCGVTELVARETCGQTCSSVDDCGTGEYCFSINPNYCECNGTRMLRGEQSK